MLSSVLLLKLCMYVQNQELIAASGVGDIVRVTSLLNSGADLEIKGGEV